MLSYVNEKVVSRCRDRQRVREGKVLLKSIEMNMSTGVSNTVSYIMKPTYTVIHEMEDGMNGFAEWVHRTCGSFHTHFK